MVTDLIMTKKHYLYMKLLRLVNGKTNLNNESKLCAYYSDHYDF